MFILPVGWYDSSQQTQQKEAGVVDLVKIGRYIAGKRKKLGLTQRQVAERLGMSDKSVSKWERGVCLPDVSVYEELCGMLGISLNEFLAGEDIAAENIVQKSEENLIDVASDSKHRQRRLKVVIYAMLAALMVAACVIGGMLYNKSLPQNFVAPVEKDSIEMETAKLLAGPDGAYIYTFTTTEEFNSLKLYFSEYQAGELQSKENMEIGFDAVGSPDHGEILIVPDFERFVVKIVIAAEGSKLSTEIPILENVPEREYYLRSASEITERTDIRYDEEQPLIALIYGQNQLRSFDLSETASGRDDALAENDYVYYFSFEFSKE